VVIKAVRDKKDQTTVAKNNQENGKKVKGKEKARGWELQ
jgi:hypothetical protein